MRRIGLILLLSLRAFGVPSEAPHVQLFVSSKARAETGLLRQKARRNLAQRSFQRTDRIYQKGAASLDEYEQSRAAAILSEFDFKIAELKAKQAAISLRLAQALARNGQRIPLCRRRRQQDENTVSRYLKRRTPVTPITFEDPQPGSGTKIQLPDPEPPQTGPTKPDPQQPDPIQPEPPGQKPGGGEDPPDPPQDPGGPQKPGAKPGEPPQKPGAKPKEPPPKPGAAPTKPPPGGGGGTARPR